MTTAAVPTTNVFDQIFKVVVASEGGFTADPHDPGNWTTGICGRGRCAGTKFGISAAAFPHTDIANLTLDQARGIYWADYWQAIRGDELPPALALLVFDAAVNSGVHKAIQWLQIAVGCEADGLIGPTTINASSAAEPGRLCAHFLALRMTWLTGLPGWAHFGLGWCRRVCALPYASIA